MLYTPPAIIAPVSAQQSAERQAHAFDFEFGAWRVHIRERVGNGWTTYTGTHVVTPIWSGRGNYGVMEISGPRGHIEGMQLRLYNPHMHQWTLQFASSANGVLGPPSYGVFANGRGEFFERSVAGGTVTVTRTVTYDIRADSYRDEIAASSDGGNTWVTTWIAQYVRIPGTRP